MEFKQISIFDYLTELDKQAEKLNIAPEALKPCYIFAMINNGVPYFTQDCHHGDEPCGLCKIDAEYIALRKEREQQGIPYFDAITKAKDIMHEKYDNNSAIA